MNPTRLLITEAFFEPMLAQLHAALEHAGIEMSVRFRPSGSATTEDFEWADSWLGFQTTGHPEHTSIRWFHSASDGINQFLPMHAKFSASGVILTHTVGTMPERIAEYCVAAVLGQIVGLPEYRVFQNAGEYHRRGNPTALGRKLTVIGTGHVGAKIAERFRPFLSTTPVHEHSEPLVRGLSLSGKPKPAFDVVAPLSSGKYLADADILVMILPDTPESMNVVSTDVLNTLNGALVVNVGRGSTLDSDALHTALDNGSVSHAILDVFETEPLPSTDWRWHHPKVTLTPHVSGYTYFSDVIEDFIANLRAIRAGQEPPHLVTLSQGY